MEQNGQNIVNDCSPSFCSCDPNLAACANGYVNNRGAAWQDIGAAFHMDRVQQRIDAVMQPAYRQEPTSELRRRIMSNRYLTQQNLPTGSMLFRRRPNVIPKNSFNSMLLRRQAVLPSQPFGRLVPELLPAAGLQSLAAPQGRDFFQKEDLLECNSNGCLSGDTDSSKSIDQSRRQKKK